MCYFYAQMSQKSLNKGGEENEQLSFLGHLEELRWKLVKSVIAIILFAVVIFIFTEPIVGSVFMNMKESTFPTYIFLCNLGEMIGVGDGMCIETIQINSIQSLDMTGQFNTNIYMALIGGLIAAFPFIFWQFWSFVKPALKDKELSVSKGVIFWASLLFFFGIAFGYFLISPLCVQFFGNYKILDSVDNNFRINSYLSMITTTTFLSGLFFELPVVIFISAKLGLVSPELLRKYRRHAIVVVLILAALITPPDVISQVMVAIPIMLLYEAGIYVSKLVVSRKQDSAR